MKSLFISAILVITVSATSYSQIQDQVSASQSRADETKPTVNPGTGELVHTIPLFTLSSKGHTIPISLTYVASGIRVESEASWVGQGWTLNAVGSVSRNLNGQPDETDIFEDQEYILGYLNTGDTDFPISSGEIGPDDHYQKKDFNPDVFNLNVPGLHTAMFSIKRREGEILPLNSTNITNFEVVDFGNSIRGLSFDTDHNRAIEKFFIKDSKGLSYSFDKPEFATIDASVFNPNLSANTSFAQSWLLSEVKSELGEEIFSFDYYSGNYPLTIPGFQASRSQSLHTEMNKSSSKLTTNTINKEYLYRIDFEDGYLIFDISSNPREDLPGHYSLESITRYNNESEPISTYKFQYSYRTGWTIGNKRLFLDRIDKFYSGSTEVAESIDFSYNSTPLPSTDSKEIDYWGFFNHHISPPGTPWASLVLTNGSGVTANGSPIPASLMKNFKSEIANRNPNLTYTAAGVLEQINYSSGRELRFKYELNEYSFIEGLDVSDEVSGQKSIVSQPASVSQNYDGYLRWNHIYFSVPYSQWVRIRFNRVGGCSSIARLTGGVHDMELDDGVYEWLYLESGINYRVKPEGDQADRCLVANPNAPPSVTINSHTHDASDPLSFRANCGGLRIKQIIEDDKNNGTFSTARNFSYDLFSDTKKSSGVLVFEPNKSFINAYAHLDGQTKPIYSQASSDHLSSVLRTHKVVYTNIEEYSCFVINEDCINNSDGLDGIGSIRKYYSFEPLSNKALQYPFLPALKDYSRRSLLSKVEYLNTDGEKVKVIENTYEHLIKQESITGAIEYIHQYHHPNNEPIKVQWYRSTHYLNSVEINRPEFITEKSYENGVYQTITKAFEYVDDDLLSNIPKEEKVILPNGEQKKHLKSYSGSFDFGGSTASGSYAEAIKALIDQGRLHEPIEEIEYFSDDFGISFIPLSRKIYLYKELPSGKVVLEKIVNRKIANPTTEQHELTQLTGTSSLSFPFTPSPQDEIITLSNFDSRNLPVSFNYNQKSNKCIIKDGYNRVVSETVNSEIQNTRYTSFENTEFNGGWKLETTAQLNSIEEASGSNYAITGNNYYDLSQSGSQFNSHSEDLDPGKYLLTYWSIGTVNTFLGNGGNLLSHTTFNEGPWTYNEKIIEFPNSNTSQDHNLVTIGGSGLIDELRLLESDGLMKTKGYYNNGTILYESGPTGQVLTYQYDNLGRLEWILDRERNVIEHHEYEKKTFDPNSYNKQTTYITISDGLSKNDVLQSSVNSSDVKRIVVYTDGLGRFRQQIEFQANNFNDERIIYSKYDGFGRQLKNYLPYYADLGTNDGYINNASSNQLDYYSSSNTDLDENQYTDYPWTERKFEKSPLQRVVSQGAVGEEFQPDHTDPNSHFTEISYGWNDASDQILVWTFDDNSYAASATTATYYSPGTLKKTTTVNPEGKKVEIFIDARGREIAISTEADLSSDASGDLLTSDFKSTIASSTHQVTSYRIYDSFNRLRYEVPAVAIERMNGNYSLQPWTPSAIFKEFVSYYAYDAKGRIFEKLVPGSSTKISYVYDNKDRVIMTQDDEQRANNKWSFVKYDSRGRAILSGELSSSLGRSVHQTNADAYTNSEEEYQGSGLFGYSDNSYPNNAHSNISLSENNILTVKYFDGYPASKPTDLNFIAFDTYTDYLQTLNGMPTASRTRVLKPDGSWTDMLWSVSYLDQDARPLQLWTEHHTGGWERIDHYYNDKGQLTDRKKQIKFNSSSAVNRLNERFTYWSKTGQLLNTYLQVNNDPEVQVSRRVYDHAGRLRDLELHNSDLQHIDYRYNAQGQLTHINNATLTNDGLYNMDDDDIFGMELTYHKKSDEWYHGSDFDVQYRHDGNISSVMWKHKTPEEDGSMLVKHAYLYDYDDLNNLTEALYIADSPSDPGNFENHKNHFSMWANYDLGGNIRYLKRNHMNFATIQAEAMDDLTYAYSSDSYELRSVADAAIQSQSSYFKHFTDGASTSQEYTYDLSGNLIQDDNRHISLTYNVLGLPMSITDDLNNSYRALFTYDAAGNKLRKFFNRPPCAPCDEPEYAMDYLGNFVFRDGQIDHIIHPEGIIRPTPVNASNQTDFVYDYFIKDYLGNVRAIITEEDATYTDKYLATMEEVYAEYEEQVFDNLDESRELLPNGFPLTGSQQVNEYVARLAATSQAQIGPSIVTPTKNGDKISLSAYSYYAEETPNATYNNVGILVEEILMALVGAGAGTLDQLYTDGQLINIASATDGVSYYDALEDWLSNPNIIDPNTLNKPNAYIIYMQYDNTMKFQPLNSGVIQVQTANELETHMLNDIPVSQDGYMHVYVTNASSVEVSFDDLLVQHMKGKVRQFNDYYPYGLSISGFNKDQDDYLYKYTGKELQTAELDPTTGTGIEMFDFHARFYDPQVGRWFNPDPAEQFSNPYLGIGNNPVGFIDPNGELVFFIPHISFGPGYFDVGLTVGIGFAGGASVQATVGHTFQDGPDNTYAAFGGTFMGVTASAGYGTQSGWFAGVGLGYGSTVSTSVTSIGVSYSENYGAGVSVAGFEISEYGVQFNPSVSISHGFASKQKASDNLLLDPNLIASNDPYAYFEYTYGPEIVGYMSGWQRFRSSLGKMRRWSSGRQGYWGDTHFGQLGALHVGGSVQFAFPIPGGSIGFGYSGGLVGDHTDLALFSTKKEPYGATSLTLDVSLEVGYSWSTTSEQVVLDRLNGPGRSVSGDIGRVLDVGLESGLNNDGTVRSINASVGAGFAFGSAKWKTNTKIHEFFGNDR